MRAIIKTKLMKMLKIILKDTLLLILSCILFLTISNIMIVLSYFLHINTDGIYVVSLPSSVLLIDYIFFNILNFDMEEYNRIMTEILFTFTLISIFFILFSNNLIVQFASAFLSIIFFVLFLASMN